MKKVGIILLLLFVSVGMMSQSFKDVPVNHWAYEAVDRLSKIGIIEGYPDGTFKGLENMNRYQLTVALSRTLDYTEKNMVAPLAQRVATLEQKINTLSTSPAIPSADLQELQNRLNTVANNVSTVQNRLDSISSNVSNLQSTVTRLDNSVKELQNSYELLGYTTTKIDELERKVNSMTASTVTKSDIDALNTRVSRVESSVTSLNSNYQNLSQTTSSLQTQVKNLEAANVTLQNSVAKASEDVARMNSLVNNLNSKVNSKVDAADFNQLKSTTEQLSTQIAANTQRISQLNSNVQNVQTNVSQLSTEVKEVRTIAESKQGGGINFLDIIISVVISSAITFVLTNVLL